MNVISNSLKPYNCSLPGSSIHGILQTRILEWVAISFSRGSSQPRDWTWVFCIAGRFFTVWATKKGHVCVWCVYTHTHTYIWYIFGINLLMSILNCRKTWGRLNLKKRQKILALATVKFWLHVLLVVDLRQAVLTPPSLSFKWGS